MGPAEAPAKGPGLYFMDTSSAAAECVTLMAAAGYVIHTFPTGQGNVVGNPIVPVIKISANPRTLRTMSEHIDVDVTGILTPRDDDRAGRRRADRDDRAHGERAGHGGRGARPSRVRHDQALSQCLSGRGSASLPPDRPPKRRADASGAGRARDRFA